MLNFEPYRHNFLPEGGAGERVRTVEDAGVIELSADDLPAVCPQASMPRWAWHPRVFLDVVNQNEAMCPYCGTHYRLRRDAQIHDHGFGARCLHQHRKRSVGLNDQRPSASIGGFSSVFETASGQRNSHRR